MDKKISRIEMLSDEVKQLHPFLQKLLPLLPNVIQVEYTHGPNEKGADFVFSRADLVLGGEEYIGVIAKSGDIRQNLDEVERQIKECGMPRHFDGGKKKIVISEIWVVASGSITNNAQEKINYQFSDKKVKFVWNERIVKLVDAHYPLYWDDIDSEIGLYLGVVGRYVEELNQRTGVLDVSLADFYVEQDLRRLEYDSKKRFLIRSKKRPELLSAVLKKENYVLLEAPMGYGKSRLLRQCAKDFANRDSFTDSRVLPVFLSYRDMVGKYKNVLKNVLDDLSCAHRVVWSDYSVTLFIDGVDEVKGDSLDKVQRMCDFIRQASAFPSVRMVFATRPFEDPSVDKDLNSHLARYELQPLTIQRLVRFVERICSNLSVTSRLKNDIQRSDLFKSLPRSPISAILLGRVLSADANELPSSLPELYSKYLDLAIGRWDLTKGIGSEKEYETSVILLRLIAKYMLDNDVSEISFSDARGLIHGYLSRRETGQASEEIFEKILAKNEIVLCDHVRELLYFKHRSFLEYMYADSIYIDSGKSADLPSPFDGYWGAVIYFYLGKLKDCPVQLQRIFSEVAPSDSAVLMRLVQAGNYLLASYQSPYDEIVKCVKSTFYEVANTYCNICENPKASRLGMFPEIHLLAIFTGLLRNAFEYDFFNKALLEVETDLLVTLDDDNRRLVTAFFIASVRAGLGCKDAFSALVDCHYSDLSTTLRLGITHAAEDASLMNDAIKKIQKKLDRAARGNKDVIRGRKVLYGVPLDQREDINELS